MAVHIDRHHALPTLIRLLAGNAAVHTRALGPTASAVALPCLALVVVTGISTGTGGR